MFLTFAPTVSAGHLTNTYGFNYHLDAEDSQTILLVQGRTTGSFSRALRLGFRLKFSISS